MSNTQELLEQRKRLNKKRPAFMRKDIRKKKKLGHAWRRARGLDSKQRLHKKGAPPVPSIGYRVPSAVRGLHNSGLIPILVSNLAQLNAITKEQGVLVSGKIGDKKRHAIISEAKKKGMVILNLDVDDALTRIETRIKERHELRNKKLLDHKEKKKSIEEKVKKEELKIEPKKEEPELSDEEKKKKEKEEKDKLLTKRE
jgi:large subunit ribosomal protein L32e